MGSTPIKGTMNTRITGMKYHYVHPPYDFWNIQYELDDHGWHKLYKSAWEIRELDMPLVDAVCYLLRAKLDCVPERQPDREFNEH